MAEKPKDHKDDASKRLNRRVGLGEALGRILDPALKRRGFTGRDIITHWGAIAPSPYDRVALPDRLAWPRGARGTEGATLYLRCAPGHALALTHEGQRIAAAINRYFGYVLVGAVRLSAEPFSPGTVEKDQARPEPSPEDRAKIEHALEPVADEGMRTALRRLGEGVAAKRR